MSAHTPGPWRVKWNPIRRAVLTVSDGHFVVEGIRGETEEERDANAVLISAAPDLLVALKLILQTHDASCAGKDCHISGIDLARVAIIKAEAKS